MARPPAPATRRPSGQRRPLAPLVLALAAVVVIADQLTKAWAVSTLSGSDRIDLLGPWLGLVLVRNPGAAFSLATGQTWVLAVVAIGVVAVLGRVMTRLTSWRWAVAAGLVLGGAVGNLIDRIVRSPGLLRGHVVDFIDYGGWFVGNVADIAIVVAAGLIVWLTLTGEHYDAATASERAERGGEGAQRGSGAAGGAR